LGSINQLTWGPTTLSIYVDVYVRGAGTAGGRSAWDTAMKMKLYPYKERSYNT